MCSARMSSLVYLTTIFYFRPRPLILIAGAWIVNARYARCNKKGLKSFPQYTLYRSKYERPQRYTASVLQIELRYLKA